MSYRYKVLKPEHRVAAPVKLSLHLERYMNTPTSPHIADFTFKSAFKNNSIQYVN